MNTCVGIFVGLFTFAIVAFSLLCVISTIGLTVAANKIGRTKEKAAKDD